MSSAMSGGPARVDRRQGCAPSSADQWGPAVVSWGHRVPTCCGNSKEHTVSVSQQPTSSRPTAGIDWASQDHAVAIVGGDGVELDRFGVPHTAAGLRRLLRRLSRGGVVEVGIERPDGPVVDALLEAGLTVLVISPNQLKNLRGRYGSAGNKDDRFDAFVLADTVRTDRARLRP